MRDMLSGSLRWYLSKSTTKQYHTGA